MTTYTIIKGIFFACISGTAMMGAAELGISVEFEKLPTLDKTQRVLATKLVRMGKDTLTYKIVSPPPAIFIQAKNEQPAFVDASLAVDKEEPVRDYRYFCCSIVPYPFGVSEIQWTDEEGRQKRVFANDDLTYLGFSFGVSVDARYYDYTTLNYGGYGNTPLSDFPADIQRYVTMARSLPRGQFLAVPAATNKLIPLTESENDAIDVMLAYYQINRDALRDAQEKAIAQSEIEAEAKRIRDLKPKAMEIRLWPVTSQRYSTTQ